MIAELDQLVREVRDLTGAGEPEMFSEDAPVLNARALEANGQGFYLVGIIGGKDVGKSALVNALVGQDITPRTSHGPGTEIAIAYAHQSQAPALRDLLDRQIPGRYRIVTHAIEHLQRQVLLDLPDIDSVHEDHVELTRHMLRHMLFPIWIQSIEKYADRQPQELLRRVTAGNAPENFLFCLNKIDQVIDREGPAAAREIRDDFAERLGRTLGLDALPRVYLLSAIHPDRYDLPRLRELLGQQKSAQQVQTAKALAARQQASTILSWVDQQDLPGRLERLVRLEADAESLVADRLVAPLLEHSVPALVEDPGHRSTLIEQGMRQRVARWPLVNVVHAVLSPVYALLHRATAAQPTGLLAGSDAIVEAYLHPEGRDLASRVQSTFAQLQQTHPQIAGFYPQRKPWEAIGAQMASADLRRRLAGALEAQRVYVQSRLCGAGPAGALVRWVLTIGALLWFPLIQPMLQTALQSPDMGVRELLLRLVEIMGVGYLLSNVSFLLLYYFILWAIVQWGTHRRVGRLLTRLRSGREGDKSLDPAAQVLAWADGLLDELRLAHQRHEGLLHRIEQFRSSLQKPQSTAA